jgi:hypothetical protein
MDTTVIPWGSPVPAFGPLMRARVATVGLNPSNREFVDVDGAELEGDERRFPTLGSLDLEDWSDAKQSHLQCISDSCDLYFARNPYDGWFKRLNRIIEGTGASYYDDRQFLACHVDLVPFATSQKWGCLSTRQRAMLLSTCRNALGTMLRETTARVVVLNGRSVVDAFEQMTETTLKQEQMADWSLPRKTGKPVVGIAYRGLVESIAGIKLKRPVLVLGYNHNIQSSFGVTNQVMDSIRHWVAASASEYINA